MIKQLRGDETKINACVIKENEKLLAWDDDELYKTYSRDFMEDSIRIEEYFFSTHVKEENLKGILNFKRATIFDMSTEEIEKALVSRKCLLQITGNH